MRYVVICKDKSGFFCTDWYEYENHWNGETIYCVIDTAFDICTFDGENWEDLNEDHL